mgnify:CR=1 FL=1
MKKKKFTIAVVISVLTLFILTGCGNKKAATVETFEQVSKEHGNEIVDITDQYQKYENIEKAIISKNTDNWNVEFYILNSNDSASSMFNLNKETFEEESEGASSQTSASFGNYETYTLTTGDYYMHLCRIDNTFLYVKVKKENKDAVKKLVKDLGY